MKPQELRIGNYAMDNKYPDVPKSILYKVVICNAYNFNEWELFEPIPLTEKWLVKFGMSGGIFHGNEHFSIARLHSCKERWGLYFEDEYTAVDFLYVHEFQNLYFALTEEELTIS